MTSDKKLLELAAKAAGIEGKFLWDGYGGGSFNTFDKVRWNPLADDGDAFRLMVKLGLTVTVDNHPGDTTEVWRYGAGNVEALEDHNGDHYAATRRAIVRAAAEIGKAM